MSADPPTLVLAERKEIRAAVIAAYLIAAGPRPVVCFTCGPAARALAAQGLDVLAIGPGQQLTPAGWWTHAAIARTWPDRFDATSGHLPLPLMLDFARALARALGTLPGPAYRVPTGSGETILALRWAYPQLTFHAAYGDTPATRRDAANPLNALVAATGPIVRAPAPVPAWPGRPEAR